VSTILGCRLSVDSSNTFLPTERKSFVHVHLDITTAKGKSKAAECAAFQTLREYEGGWEVAKPLDCAAYPRFGFARSARRQ
jgi:hypothetical protein